MQLTFFCSVKYAALLLYVLMLRHLIIYMTTNVNRSTKTGILQILKYKKQRIIKKFVTLRPHN